MQLGPIQVDRAELQYKKWSMDNSGAVSGTKVFFVFLLSGKLNAISRVALLFTVDPFTMNICLSRVTESWKGHILWNMKPKRCCQRFNLYISACKGAFTYVLRSGIVSICTTLTTVACSIFQSGKWRGPVPCPHWILQSARGDTGCYASSFWHYAFASRVFPDPPPYLIKPLVNI